MQYKILDNIIIINDIAIYLLKTLQKDTLISIDFTKIPFTIIKETKLTITLLIIAPFSKIPSIFIKYILQNILISTLMIATIKISKLLSIPCKIPFIVWTYPKNNKLIAPILKSSNPLYALGNKIIKISCNLHRFWVWYIYNKVYKLFEIALKTAVLSQFVTKIYEFFIKIIGKLFSAANFKNFLHKTKGRQSISAVTLDERGKKGIWTLIRIPQNT